MIRPAGRARLRWIFRIIRLKAESEAKQGSGLAGTGVLKEDRLLRDRKEASIIRGGMSILVDETPVAAQSAKRFDRMSEHGSREELPGVFSQ
jgi:hypothetical protein